MSARMTPRPSPVSPSKRRPLQALLHTTLDELSATGALSAATARALRGSALAGLAAPPTGGRPYGRRVLHAGPRGEIMLAAWRDGARSAPHDHGGAGGLVLVLAGRFEERVFEGHGRGLGAIVGTHSFGAGDHAAVPPERIHDMGCVAGPGLTLHLYPGAAGVARVFDAARSTTFHVRGGAWLPPDEVLRAEAWGSEGSEGSEAEASTARAGAPR